VLKIEGQFHRKRAPLPIQLHDVTSKKIIIFIIVALKASNFTSVVKEDIFGRPSTVASAKIREQISWRI
jgi:hypothetical protein